MSVHLFARPRWKARGLTRVQVGNYDSRLLPTRTGEQSGGTTGGRQGRFPNDRRSLWSSHEDLTSTAPAWSDVGGVRYVSGNAS